jgi:hypothetical protein
MKVVFVILLIILILCLPNISPFGLSLPVNRFLPGGTGGTTGPTTYTPTYSTSDVNNYINQNIPQINGYIDQINAAFKKPVRGTPPNKWISKLHDKYLPGDKAYKDIQHITPIDTSIKSIYTTSTDKNNVVYYINNILVPQINELYKDPRIINYYTGPYDINPMENYVYSSSATHPNTCKGGPPCDVMVYLQSQDGFKNLWYILNGVVNFVTSQLKC